MSGSLEMTSCSAPQAGHTITSPMSGISSSRGIGEPHSLHDDIFLMLVSII